MTTWTNDYTYTLSNGTILEPGMVFKCFNEKGKTYRFIKAVTNPNQGTTWIDCFGGSHGREQSRAISPERVNPSSIKKPKRKAE